MSWECNLFHLYILHNLVFLGRGWVVQAINPGTIRTPLVTDLLEMGGADYTQAGRPYPLESRCGEIDEIGGGGALLSL